MARVSELRGNIALEDGKTVFGRIAIVDGTIGAVDVESLTADHRADFIVPGFIDVHVHGGGGADVMDATPDALKTIEAVHSRHGTTAWLATTVSAPPREIDQAIDCVRRSRDGGDGSLVGIHLEGPFINPKQRGAMKTEYILGPDASQFREWIERGEGLVKMITLAPEMEDSDGVIGLARERGIIVSAGHSMATWKDMERAEAAGVTHLTHLFNAMRPLNHREPGIIGYAARHRGLSVDFIADGVHLHPEIIELMLSLFGTERLMLITDAMRASGLGDGTYVSAGLHTIVTGGVARIKNGSLAGSLLTMDEAFWRLLRAHGRSLSEVSRMASTNAARLLGLEGRKGSIAVGRDADLVCLSPEGRVKQTIRGGVTD